jgi:hypothetical protein
MFSKYRKFNFLNKAVEIDFANLKILKNCCVFWYMNPSSPVKINIFPEKFIVFHLAASCYVLENRCIYSHRCENVRCYSRNFIDFTTFNTSNLKKLKIKFYNLKTKKTVYHLII